jgi:antitoxin component YwqK of YwqJK toxin-antitoxin module
MKVLAILCFVMLTNILPAQKLSFVKDSIMQAYMESGYASKYFVPNGRKDKYDLRQGRWSDYETEHEALAFNVDGEPLEIFGTYLFYGEGEFKNSKRTGDWNIYIIEDKTFKKILSRKVSYVDGMADGNFTYFYPDGKVERTGNYVKGQVQDSVIVYYTDGNLFGRRFYKDGQKSGEQKYFFRSGKLKYVVHYYDGFKEGHAEKYYENGKIEEASDYKADSLQGAYNYYYSNGQLWTERFYEKGHLLNVTKLYDKYGKELEKGSLKDGNGTINFYTQEGEIYLTQTYVNGVVTKEDKM